MAAISKQLYAKVAAEMTCQQLFHPWSKSCINSNSKLLIDALRGSSKFYFLIYLVQIAMQGKKLKQKETWIKMLEYYARSTLLGIAVSVSYVNIVCALWAMGVKKTYFNSMLFPFMLNGLFIYLEPPHRRTLIINLFANLLIEYYLNCLSISGYFVMTKFKQVFLFMTGNALLFYFMRLEGDKKRRTPLFWLYTAEKVNHKPDDSNNVCPHKGLCWKYILKGTSTYFGVGMAISMAKLILPRIRSPIKAISSIRGRHFKLALFFGSYIGIYRALICYFCRENKHDSAEYALPAGFIAGLSMVFSPNTGMGIASLTAAFKLYSTILYEKKVLPTNLPLPEMMYCLCQGILFSARIANKEACPSYVINLLDTIGRGHCEDVYQRITKHTMSQITSKF